MNLAIVPDTPTIKMEKICKRILPGIRVVHERIEKALGIESPDYLVVMIDPVIYYETIEANGVYAQYGFKFGCLMKIRGQTKDIQTIYAESNADKIDDWKKTFPPLLKEFEQRCIEICKKLKSK